MLRLWLSELREDSGENPALQLSTYRQKQLESVRNARLRAQMIAAERLLIAGLREFGLEPPLHIGVSEKGKPFLQNSPLFFSLSHSGEFAACAVSDAEVGVDIQTPETLRESLTERFFTGEEQAQLRDSRERDADFTALWCCKESYLKALGVGLYTPLNSFTVRLTDPPRLEGDEALRFWLCRDPRFTLALCAYGNAEPEQINWL